MRSELPEAWKLLELADVGVSVLDCEHKTPPDAGKGHPYIAIPNLVDGRLNLTRVRLITDEQLRVWTRRTRPQAGDIIVTRRARVGDSAVVPNGLHCAIGQNLVILRSVGGRVDQRFLRWATRGPLWHQEVNRLRNVGAVFDSLNVRDVARIRIPVPPIEQQRAVAAVLGTLNDKIDTDRRLAGLLEETIEAVSRARFVEFVGVEDLVEQSGMWPLPRGWRAGSLADLGRFVNGRAFTKHATGDGRPIIRIRELNGGIDARTPRSDIDAGDDHVARDDDILFAWSGSLGVYRWTGPEALINQHIFKVMPEHWPGWFVHFWIRHHMSEFQAIARDRATTMGHIQRRHLADAFVALPDHAAITAARDVLDPIDQQRAGLAAEMRTLHEVLDSLLPKLISGEIRVSDTADPDEVIGPVATLAATK